MSSTLAGGATHSPSPSGTSSPVPLGPAKLAAASGVSPAKAAELLSAGKLQSKTAKDAASTSKEKEVKDEKDKDNAAESAATTSAAPESAPMSTATSTAGQSSAAVAPVPAPLPSVAPATRAGSSLGINGAWTSGGGTFGGGERGVGLLGAGRDPRGKARSRDYLKQ